MKLIKELWKTFKKPLIVLGVFLLLFLIIGKVVPALREKEADDSPVVKITASNGNTYAQGQEINVEDFEITAVHENGVETEVPFSDIRISKKYPDTTGKKTEITVETKDGNHKCRVSVKNERKKLITFECGYPDVSAVKAVLYSNGELLFEGEGEILAFTNEEFPWKSYEGDNDNPVRSITFEDTVTPTSMDGFFTDMEMVTYVESIPVTVESMVGTFRGCTSLKAMPNLTGCEKLLDLTEAFSGCISLEETSAIPPSVKNMSATFRGCTMLKKGADVSKAAGVVNADALYSGCTVLNDAELPFSVQSAESAFEECINLKVMPEIPPTLTNMRACFRGNISLTELSPIPGSVTDVSDAFNGCTKIRGTMVVNSNPENYSGFLAGTASATSLDLQGQSKILDVLAGTSDRNMNITVNGKTPDWDADYNDIIDGNND